MSIRIRMATTADAAAVLEIYGPFCSDTAVSFETCVPTLEEMKRRIAKTVEVLPWLVATSNERVIGYAYASQHRERPAYRWAVDVSVYVAAGSRRSGLGRGLYSALISILREQGYYRALAGTTLPNPSSEGLHQSMGFERLGVYRSIGYQCGAWQDVAWWELAIREASVEEPGLPRDVGLIFETAEWIKAIQLGEAIIGRPDKETGGSSPA